MQQIYLCSVRDSERAQHGLQQVNSQSASELGDSRAILRDATVFAEAGQGGSVKGGVGKLGLSVHWQHKGLAETEKR